MWGPHMVPLFYIGTYIWPGPALWTLNAIPLVYCLDYKIHSPGQQHAGPASLRRALPRSVETSSYAFHRLTVLSPSSPQFKLT